MTPGPKIVLCVPRKKMHSRLGDKTVQIMPDLRKLKKGTWYRRFQNINLQLALQHLWNITLLLVIKRSYLLLTCVNHVQSSTLADGVCKHALCRLVDRGRYKRSRARETLTSGKNAAGRWRHCTKDGRAVDNALTYRYVIVEWTKVVPGSSGSLFVRMSQYVHVTSNVITYHCSAWLRTIVVTYQFVKYVIMQMMFILAEISRYKTKGSFTIIDIYESVHSVRFLMTPSPSPKAYSKMLIFSK